MSKKLYRICIHHTAGTYKPNVTDLSHYHFLIDSEGNIHKGKFEPEDNIDCKDGKYAEHCALGNTGAIGVAYCGNRGDGKYPLTKKQLEAGFKLCAELVLKYNIMIAPATVYTHMEYDKLHAHKGKIDIEKLPQYAVYGYTQVGNFIRNKVLYYTRHIG